MLDLLPHILNGLTLGLLFALIALGFMLIVGLMEQINLAHGSLFALGAYFAMQLMGPRPPLPQDIASAWLALPLGWRYAAALIIAPMAAGAIGIAIEFCMRRTYGKDPLYGLLLTFGAAMVIEETIRLIWGTRDYVLQVPQAINGGVLFGDLIWSTYRFYAAGISAVIIGLVWLLIEKTPFGAIVKAGAHDSEIVRALGINLTRLRLLVFVFGTMLAAIAGIIVAPIWGIRPHMGVDAVIPAFLVIVLGGVGSFWGAVVAGLLVGLAVGLSGAYASEWSLLSMYVLLVAVVTFRARGLWGKKSVLEA
ncbi:branched-chain amino acid ABC transporter permease [Bradyrhizobium sp. WSM 1738]|uniref:branched-chain amino acid ABC transporter permease n=1 Tax=Bradyrhizobium hereditatis TaxID=2821405 RepID=UPI001CE31CFD|nr:branched-chain amino acid ABC transporter permease [Bradyrhizobium hereditatis]MCA6114620.1 branched-chain amino acid ABC transporter permease [Bradyrhizobium hereditatis]